MCILFLAVNQHPEYPVIICANRDEFHDRPSQSAHFWSDHPDILAGKDLEACGSWLGINKEGKFAAVTNIRTGQKINADKKSRGHLVTMALKPDSVIDKEWLIDHCNEYKPFNLIYGSLNKLSHFNSMSCTQSSLNDGFHAISNGFMDDVWPKMAKGEKHLEAIVNSDVKINPERLLAILKDQSRVIDEQLPDTGVSKEMEQLLSSIFICSTNYGTRSSSLILQHANNSVDFIEAEYGRFGDETNRVSFSL